MKKFSLFIDNFTDDIEKGLNCVNTEFCFDYGTIIKNKDEALKAVVFLMNEWEIKPQDFIDEYNKRKRGK